jgi:rhodanese-related sulfurtransferase
VNVFGDEASELSPQRVAELLERGEIQLVDVREPHEWDAGRIAGARHIELERLAGRAAEIDRQRPVVFQCRLGARSAMATAAFRASGWDAYNLTGGLQAWADAGLPLEPTGGRVADH